MVRSLIILLICLLPSVVWSAPQYSYPAKAAPVAGDKVLIVDSQDSWRTKNVLFSSFNGLTSLPTADNQIIQATGAGTYEWTSSVAGLIDDTAGNGDTDKLWSADKVFDSIAASTNHQVITASKATTYTIGTDAASEAYGGTIYVTSATTITAPAVASGMNFSVVTIGDIAVSLDLNASDKMVLDGVTLADGDKATNSSKSGDTITCQYYSADGFYCWSGTVLGGHWTDGN